MFSVLHSQRIFVLDSGLVLSIIQLFYRWKLIIEIGNSNYLEIQFVLIILIEKWHVKLLSGNLYIKKDTYNIFTEKYIFSNWKITTNDSKFEYYEKFILTIAAAKYYNLQTFDDFDDDESLNNIDFLQVAFEVKKTFCRLRNIHVIQIQLPLRCDKNFMILYHQNTAML